MNPQTLYTLAALSTKQLTAFTPAVSSSDFITADNVLLMYTGNSKKPLLPKTITKIGQLAFFQNQTVEEIILPREITAIDAYAFLGCPALKKIQLPDTVTELHPKAFVDYDGKIYAPRTLEGCSAFNSHEVVYPSAPKSTAANAKDSVAKDFIIEGKMLIKYKGTAKSIVIPNNITSIENYAFSNCKSVTSIILPDSITSIGRGAFWACKSLTSIVLPNRITSIANDTFWNCESLSSLNLPKSITSIGRDAFGYCQSLTSLKLPENIKHLHEDTFRDYNGKILAPLHLKYREALNGHKVQYY